MLLKRFLALSCLQGRPMQAAAAELWSLSPDGLQLTPGNVPSLGFQSWLSQAQIPFLTHHGFCWQALRQKVWNANARCRVDSHSVHPPQAGAVEPALWWKMLETTEDLPLLETMYPGYLLGTGAELERAMDLNLTLAVDVSHLHLQVCQGVLADDILRRLWTYERIGEIHLSHNRGQHDSHLPLQKDSFGLAWALERGQHIPLVLECYLHKLSLREREAQMALVETGT